MAFESPARDLSELLRSVGSGEVKLPDFQREFKWDDQRIKALLASVSRDYPIGAITTVETGGDGARFRLRPLRGADDGAEQRHPSLVLIDGQQRLTSLYQALMSGQPVRTVDQRGADIQRWYYVDIDKALTSDDNREEAIIAIPPDRKKREDFGRKVVGDYSTEELECRAGMFPLRIVFDPNKREDWAVRYRDLGSHNWPKWQRFRTQVLDPIVTYRVPLIKLAKDTPREAVCTIFEKVNTGGLQLTAFELLTASLARADEPHTSRSQVFSLSEDWKRIRARLLGQHVLGEFATEEGNPAFLQTACLLVTRKRRLAAIEAGSLNPPAVSCKRTDMLKMSLEEYLEFRDTLVSAFKWAGQFLNKECIYQARDVPYPTQLVPLAAIRAVVGGKADNHGTYAKIRRWFWCGVLGELYGGMTETRSARDLEQVLSWIAGTQGEPETVVSASFHENRLLTLSTRTSGAYKGLYALIMANGCYDWLKHQRLDFATVNDLRVDVHHVFPRAWCKQKGIRSRLYDSIVNKTAISYDTNRSIGDHSPADYLPDLERRSGVDSTRMDELVGSHQISARYLRTADFDSFFEDRTTRLLDLVASAIGKPVVRRQEAPAGDDPQDFPEDTVDATGQ